MTILEPEVQAPDYVDPVQIQLLNAIASFDERGWCTYSLEDRFGRRCLMGHIVFANSGPTELDSSEIQEACNRIHGALWPHGAPTWSAIGVSDHDGRVRAELVHWNNHMATAREVRAAFVKAAA